MHILYAATQRVDQRLLKALREFGHTVEVTQTAADGPEIARLGRWDAIVADAGAVAPHVAWLEQLSQAAPDANLIAVTGQDGIDTRVDAFRVGTDAWFVRPVSIAELGAKIEALSRGRRRGGRASISDLQLNATARSISAPSGTVALSRHEYGLIRLFLECSGAVLGADEILHRIWGEDVEPDPNLVRTTVSRLRSKLAKIGVGDLIETVWGHGYRVKTGS